MHALVLLCCTVLVSEVRELVVGKDCPHVKSSGKKPVSGLVLTDGCTGIFHGLNGTKVKDRNL